MEGVDTQDIEMGGDDGNGNGLADIEMPDADDNPKDSISDALESDSLDPGMRLPTRSLLFAFADKDLVTDSSDTTSETEEVDSLDPGMEVTDLQSLTCIC